MIYLYISPSCQSCRKTVAWFKEHSIDTKEINIVKDPLSKEDILRMLRYSENGFDDIISRRSKPFLESGIDLEGMKTSELMEFIIENPTVLKRPIIVAKDLLEVGYNREDIRAFIPHEKRCFLTDGCRNCRDRNPLTCEHLDESTLLFGEPDEEPGTRENEEPSSGNGE